MTPPHPSADKSVALVTLGCTRNEVDSEELAGRLLAGGWRLVDDAVGGRRRRRQHVRLRRAGQEGLHRRAARGLRPQGRRRPHAEGRRGRLPRRALRQGARRPAARGRRRARLRLVPRHERAPADDPRRWPRREPHPGRPPHPAAADARQAPGRRRRRRAARARRRAPRPRRRRRAHARLGPPGHPRPPRRAAVGAAEDRVRLRPPLLVLRHPDVPRRLPLPPPRRRHRRGPLARPAGRQGALPRLRELDVLRQGPRRPRPCSRSCSPS